MAKKALEHNHVSGSPKCANVGASLAERRYASEARDRLFVLRFTRVAALFVARILTSGQRRNATDCVGNQPPTLL